MDKPIDWPRSALFIETSPDAIKRQREFYYRCYGNTPKENLSDRVTRHLAYLDYVSVPEQYRVQQSEILDDSDRTNRFSQIDLDLFDL